MTSEQGLAAGKNPSWTLNFWNRVHRYRCLVMKFWWILVFLLSACLCVAAWYLATKAPSYLSAGSLIIEQNTFQVGDANNKGGAIEIDEKFIANQIAIMKGANVAARAADRLMAQYPDVGGEIIRDGVQVDYRVQNTMIVLNALGKNPLNTQRYLEAHINSFLDYRRITREAKLEETLGKVRKEIANAEEELRRDDADMIAFQRDQNVVMQTGEGNSANTELQTLRKKLADLRSESDQLMLATPEQALVNPIQRRGGDNANSSAAGDRANSPQQQSTLESSNASTEYRSAQQALAKDKADLDNLSRDLKPKHPKIMALNQDIDRQNKIIASLVNQNGKMNANRLALVASLIKTTEQQIKEAESKTINYDQLQHEYGLKEAKKERDMKNYTELQVTLRNGLLSTNVAQEDIHIVERPSVGVLVPTSWSKVISVAILAGLASGIGILLLIDRMDDRMNSISDFQLHFAEHVVGQIPRDAEAGTGENTELLRPDDQRHQLVESFRNLRSTLLFMPLDGVRPKTLLITSAVPNEGKSTVSSNLALVLASAGMKTLLIDADLRRGAIHHAFNLTRDPGLTDVLGHSVNWKLAIRDTGVENLHVLPRGRNVMQPSEYLLNRSTDLLLKELYPLYDYIIIDSSPVLAADDTASLAPKIDATLFVVRLSFTSAKMTRKSLEILYKRQANIPGLILNQVDTSSPDFVYYQYSEYYHAAPVDDEPVKTS